MTPDVGSSQLLEIALWALWVTAVLRSKKAQKHKKSTKKCDVTESVTLRDRDRGSRSTGRKGFSPEINPVLLSFMSLMRVSRSVIPCGEMVRVLFRHSW